MNQNSFPALSIEWLNLGEIKVISWQQCGEDPVIFDLPNPDVVLFYLPRILPLPTQIAYIHKISLFQLYIEVKISISGLFCWYLWAARLYLQELR